MKHTFRFFSILILFSCTAETRAETYTEAVLGDSPVVYYRFEAAADGVIPDFSGNGRDGKLAGGAVIHEASAGENLGKCLKLHGGRDAVKVACEGDKKIGFAGKRMSVELWMRYDGSGVWGTILNADAWRDHGVHFQFHPDGPLQFCVERVNPENAFFDFFALPKLRKTRWNHVVVTYDAATVHENVKLYVNGRYLASATLGAGEAFTLGDSFTVGNWQDERGFSGMIDELAIYDKVLTPAQIAKHFQSAGEIPDHAPEAPFRMADETRERLLERGVEKIAFVKRYTYTSNHYYTEYINSRFMPGGSLCVLDVKTGELRELCPELSGGVFERMDVNFDATKIVFAWKKSEHEGYRIYEADISTGECRQVLAAPENEKTLVARYRNGYHHGTDDMSPCYLPDGGICFISTRCQYGILCDAPDIFTTTVLYRCDADGGNLRKLSNSSVSEAAPVCLSDGRILYTRWEYVDKGAVSVKCLWTMRPDGTGSAELYGNDISVPPTFIYGREIPDSPGFFVFTGTPHCPQSGMGAVIRLDTNKNIRTREPMTYMTPTVDVQEEWGWVFRDETEEWKYDWNGHGPLFKEAFPLSMTEFLVAHKPRGEAFTSPAGYGIYLLDEAGNVAPVYRDAEISCWNPVVLRARPVPPELHGMIDETLAEQNLAHCVVMDVYHGLENIPRGAVKYLRVLEQIPRPWGARRPDYDDEYDQQHVVVSKDASLGLKVQHGVVPVAEDGSASFLVPAEANIYFQALDENYLALQTERTYVNYMPGETRACIGCHETPESAQSVDAASRQVSEALKTPPRLPVAQLGETEARRVLDYTQDVQPVWDRHCVSCHAPATDTHPERKIEGDLNLSGEMTAQFNVSYENLVPERRRNVPKPDRGLLGVVIGENHPKTGNVHYLPAKSLGSHTSVLAAMLSSRPKEPGMERSAISGSDGSGLQDSTRSEDCAALHPRFFFITLADPAAQARVEKLRESHREIQLSPEEFLKVTNWIDTNCQFYGSYHGRRNLKYRGEADFRPFQTFEMAKDKKE